MSVNPEVFTADHLKPEM